MLSEKCRPFLPSERNVINMRDKYETVEMYEICNTTLNIFLYTMIKKC